MYESVDNLKFKQNKVQEMIEELSTGTYHMCHRRLTIFVLIFIHGWKISAKVQRNA